MLDVPKKAYLPYPVTKQWGDDVRAEISKRPRGTQARLLEHLTKRGIKISSGHLSDILGGKYETSDIVEPVHEFLGWAPPMPPIASRDVGELVHLNERLTEEQRAFIAAGASQVAEMSGDEARQKLAEMLKLFSSSEKPK